MIKSRFGTLVIAALTAACYMGSVHADEQTDRTLAAGKQRFMQNCAACHGENAQGAGIVATHLETAPADLTQLSKNNGGSFPFKSIYDTIDGRTDIGAHGSRDMPVWGAEYKLGTPTAGGMSESVVRGRILELIVYLQSIQE
jgi:mono/diheme cytochrome c family protein